MRKFLTFFTMLMLSGVFVFAQSRTISGKVTDEKGGVLSDVSILVKGTTIGTVTGNDGTYKLSIPSTAKVLVFSSVNTESKEVTIGSQTIINTTLNSAAAALSEVVIVGYQTVKKADLTGSVSNVTSEKIAQKPIGSFTNLLQGQAAGVQVTGQSGRPGSNAYIRVRGTGSINASNEPLIILDGIPISAVSYSLLNPDDIENISILKDAASQAIYGSRAANGVIVITSKKGSGKPEVTYSFQYGKSRAQELKNISLMNSAQKLQYEFEGHKSNPIIDSMIQNRIVSGAFPGGSDLFSISADQRNDIWNTIISRAPKNWEDYLLQDAKMMRHEVSVSGSGDKFRYYFSLNKSDNDGVLYGSYWNKTGGRLNIEYKALDWFKMGTNIGVTHSKENNVRSLFNTQNSYASLFLINPYEPVYLPNGKYNLTHEGYSPLEGTDFNPSVLDRISSYSTVYGELNFFKHLTLKSQLGVNYNTLSQENYLMPGANLADILGYSSKTDAGNRDFVYAFTNTANWKQTINSVHSINLLAGQEFTKDKFYSYRLTSQGFPTPSVNTQDNGGKPTEASTTRTDWALLSYFGNATYGYDNKYFVNFSGRRDGSSRFGANKRFANFWAVGATWDVKKEDFVKPDFISTLKLRASIGTAGTVPSALYDNLGTYALTTKYNGLSTATPARLPNPDLTWELNHNYDLGVDFGFFENRIKGTVDYYRRKTDNLIYPKNVSLTTGFSSFSSNIGNLENKGIEVSLNSDVVRTNDLRVNVFASYSHNDNKILSLYSNNVPQDLSMFVEGQPLFTYYLVRWAGINPSNGKNLFYKADGTITQNYVASDAVLLKGKTPLVKFFGSFGVSVDYKGIDLNAMFYYSGGNYIMNYIYQVGASEGENISDQQLTEAANYWKKPGDIVSYANLNDLSQRTTFDTDKYLEKGDYVSLRDLTIGYTLPNNVAKKIKMKGLRMYVQGTNLWIGTKFKGLPEVGEPNGESTVTSPGLYNLYGQPQMRAITAGVNVTF